MDVPGAVTATPMEYNKDYTDCKPGTAAACMSWTRAAQACMHVLPRGVRLLARVGETPVKFIAVPLWHADLVGGRGQLSSRPERRIRSESSIRAFARRPAA